MSDVTMRSCDDGGEEEEEKKTSQYVPSKTPGGKPDKNIITVSVTRLQKPHEDMSCPQWTEDPAPGRMADFASVVCFGLSGLENFYIVCFFSGCFRPG